jgi:hypothetical protein
MNSPYKRQREGRVYLFVSDYMLSVYQAAHPHSMGINSYCPVDENWL